MDPRLPTLLEDKLPKLTEAVRSLPEPDLWVQLIVDICHLPPGKAGAQRAPSHLGMLRGEQRAPIESLVNDFNLVRRYFEDLLAEVRSSLSAEDEKAAVEIRANLDMALSTAVGAYFQKRSVDARRDPITGLPDRAAFEVCLDEEIGRARRYHRTFSLVLFDLDHFKRINDRLGHPEGDRVLAEVGDVLSRTLRRSDQVFRYGGDEFAALCPETGEPVMKSVLLRIEHNLGEIRLSWGVASFPGEASDAAKLVSLADERLYRCKRSHHETIP